MNGIIFAAGLGSRLKPLTNNCPKALVKLNGKPLLWYAIQKLIDAGVTQIVVNIHHFGEQIIDYLGENHFKVPILISDERHVLLDTGGALLKAKHNFNNNAPTIAYNVDIISSVNLSDVVKYHHQNKALATLVVRQRDTNRYFMFNNEMRLCAWKNFHTGEEIKSKEEMEQSTPWAFSGIQILSPEIFDHITEKGKFSVVPLYLRLAKEHKIVGFRDQSDFWLDVGKPGQLEIAEKHLKIEQANDRTNPTLFV